MGVKLMVMLLGVDNNLFPESQTTLWDIINNWNLNMRGQKGYGQAKKQKQADYQEPAPYTDIQTYSISNSKDYY